MQYQIQEILRIEKVFEAAAIEEELEAYNPLIPDGSNFKATFMIEYEDEHERRHALTQLLGVERCIWVRIGDLDKVYPIANEDLERETEDKTSAVHFLRFEFTAAMIQAAKSGAVICIGVEHDNYTHETGPLSDGVRDSLVGDLQMHH